MKKVRYANIHINHVGKKVVIASGTQALVRLMLNQAFRDRQNGINSAGLVTGYRGSPLGGVDATFTKAEKCGTIYL